MTIPNSVTIPSHRSPEVCFLSLWVSFLAFLNSAAMNTGLYVSFWIMFFSEHVSRNGISGSYDSSIFNVLGGMPMLLSMVAALIYIPTNSVGGFPFLHTLSSFYCLWIFFFFFLTIVILADVRSYLIVVLISLSLTISNIEYLSMYLLALCMSSLGEHLLWSSAHFSSGLFALMLLNVMSYL